MILTRLVAAWCLGVALAATGCSPSSSPPPGVPSSPPSGDSPPVPGQASPAQPGTIAPSEPPADSERTMAPTQAPTGQEFGFDEAARYADGVQFEVQRVAARRAGQEDRGAEGTDGNIVVATVLVSNASTSTFDASRVLVQGFYGAGVGAPLVVDPEGSYGIGFVGVVEAGEEVQSTFAFAIPHSQLDNVTVAIYSLDEANHPAVQFAGRVAAP